jgi:hypothetical protein
MIEMNLKNENYNEILHFYKTTYEKLTTLGYINLLENEKFREYNSLFVKRQSENKIELNEHSAKLQEIKKLGERVLEFIKNKKEYDYVKDYFISESTLDGDEIFNQEYEKEETEEDYKLQPHTDSEYDDHDFKNISKFLNKNMNSISISNKQNFYELLSITSKEYLKNNIKLDDELIKLFKGSLEEIPEIEDGSSKNEENINSNSNSNQKVFIDNDNELYTKNNFLESLNIKKQKNEDLNSLFLNKKNLSGVVGAPGTAATVDTGATRVSSKSKASTMTRSSANKSSELSKIEKEMEEEVNNEIFNYTKNMKNYARNFNQILVQDNKKLDKIEKIQETGKNKTNKSMKSLNEFNYSLKIGFLKLILYIILVGTTFVMTLISIRIFPKLVK